MESKEGNAVMNIFQRLNEVRKAVAYIRKDKKVETYMAVTHDAVTAEIRDSLIKHGVMIVPVEIESRMIETGAVTGKGSPWMRFEGKYRIEFVNIDESSDRTAVELTSHALDYGDKAPGKALSYATKYAILKIFNIETGEDEEGRPVMSGQKEPLTQIEIAGHIAIIKACTDSEAKKISYAAAIAACLEHDDRAAADAIKLAVTPPKKVE
jgi:hypothetical protein